jgi:hypothetical protein
VSACSLLAAATERRFIKITPPTAAPSSTSPPTQAPMISSVEDLTQALRMELNVALHLLSASLSSEDEIVLSAQSVVLVASQPDVLLRQLITPSSARSALHSSRGLLLSARSLCAKQSRTHCASSELTALGLLGMLGVVPEVPVLGVLVLGVLVLGVLVLGVLVLGVLVLGVLVLGLAVGCVVLGQSRFFTVSKFVKGSPQLEEALVKSLLY